MDTMYKRLNKMDTANGEQKFIQVHETCLTDFLKNFDGCVKIMAKEGDLYTVEVFIMDKSEYPMN